MFVVIGLPLVIQIVGNQIRIGLAGAATVQIGVAAAPQPETRPARLRRLLMTPGVN